MLVKYKCRCMRAEREIVVTDRVKDSDIGMWMNLVLQPSVTYDHNSTKPLCINPVMDYVKIPVDEESGQVGVPEVRN